jgi:hypothetical protein
MPTISLFKARRTSLTCVSGILEHFPYTTHSHNGHFQTSIRSCEKIGGINETKLFAILPATIRDQRYQGYPSVGRQCLPRSKPLTVYPA